MGLTSVGTVATGDTIAASTQNTMRDNDLVLDGRTGGDPGAAGKLLRSSSSVAGTWVAALTAVLDALGYTPVNKAGDTGIGPLTASSLSSTGNIAANGTVQAAAGTFTNLLSVPGSTGGVSVEAAAAVRSSGVNVQARSGHTGTQLAATISDFAATVATLAALSATTATTATNATQLGSIPAAGYPTLAGGGNFTAAPTINAAAIARIQTGSYTGNGAASRTISLSPAFTPSLVIVYKASDFSLHIITPSFGIAFPSGIGVSASIDTTTTNGFVVHDAAGTNTNGHNYAWIALG